MIDLCIISTLRPEILDHTLRSYTSMVKYSGQTNVILNIDQVPSFDNKSDQVSAILKLFDKYNLNINQLNIPNFPSFTRAVKWGWLHSTADYVFHLEDDWKFINKIKLDDVISSCEKRKILYTRFPKLKAAVLNKVALQPSLWKGSLCRELAAIMSDAHDPEKQLRVGLGINPKMDKTLPKLTQIWDWSGGPFCDDIGRKWRDSKNLQKWNKNISGDITWIKG